MKRRTKILIGIAVLLVAAVAFAVVRSRRGKDITAVTMAKVSRMDLTSKVSANGKIDAKRKVDLSANVMGQIINLAVRERDVFKIGTMNNPGTKLLTIADMSVVEAVMEVDETDVPNVKVGQHANVTVDAYPNKTFAGIVTEVGSSPIQRTGGGTEAVNFEVKIQLE